MKVTLSEIKKNLQGTNSWVDEAEHKINDLEHKEEKTFNQNSKKKEEPPQNKDRLRSLWDKFKHNNIHIIGVPKGEENKQEIGDLFKIVLTENLTLIWWSK